MWCSRLLVYVVLLSCLSRGLALNSSNVGDDVLRIPHQGKRHFVIGVLAIRGAEKAFAEYNQTFSEHLTREVGNRFEPRISFSMLALNHKEVRPFVQTGVIDFLCANPAIFSCIDSEFGASSLATLKREISIDGETHLVDSFGGVIIARRNRDDIASVSDVRGKKYATASISGLGSGQAQFRELFKRGLSFIHDVEQAIFTSNQNDVVKLVESGIADVGFIRENQLPKMTASGDIDPSDFKFLDAELRDYNGGKYPYPLTTDLFPEWNLAALSSVGSAVSSEVQLALLEMEPGHPASVGRYHSWGPTKSYMLLRNMQDDLGYIRRNVEKQQMECMWGESLYDAVVCPAGFYKESEDVVVSGCDSAGLGCPEGFECLCKPCRQGYEVDIVPRSEMEMAAAGLSAHCQRMATCEAVEQGQSTLWVLRDNKQRLERLAIQIRYHEPIGSGDAAAMEDGSDVHVVTAAASVGEAFLYSVELPGRMSTGLHVVELLLDGQHLEASPLFLHVLPRDCQRDFPGAHRAPNEGGECVCDESTVTMAGKCVPLKILPVLVVAPLVVLFAALAWYLMRSARRGAGDEEEHQVERRIKALRQVLWIQRQDGFRVDGEWAGWRESAHIKTRMLENLARATLLLDFDIRQVDMLTAVLRFFGTREGDEDDKDALLDSTSRDSSGLEGEAKQYLAIRHLLLEISKRVLDPSLPDGVAPAGGGKDAFSWSRKTTASERFEFFRDKIAKLRIWEEGQNYLYLKGVAQMFLDDLRRSCDDLYSSMKREQGGKELISLVHINTSVCVSRQDHPEVQAIPIVETLSREVRLRKMTSPMHSPLPKITRPKDAADASPTSSPRPRKRSRVTLSDEVAVDAFLTSFTPPRERNGKLTSSYDECPADALLDSGFEDAPMGADYASSPAARSPAAVESPPPPEEDLARDQAIEIEEREVGIRKLLDIPDLVVAAETEPVLQHRASGASEALAVNPEKKASMRRIAERLTSLTKEEEMMLRVWLRTEGAPFEHEMRRRPSSLKDSLRDWHSSKNIDEERLSRLKAIHAGLKENVKAKDKAGPQEGLSNEEPFVVHLGNRAQLLNDAFQCKVKNLFSEWGAFCNDTGSFPTVYRGPVKTKLRMMEKVTEYSEEFDDSGQDVDGNLPLAALILDPIRVSLVCANPLQVLQCTKWLVSNGAAHDLPVVRLKNKFAAQDSIEYDGYRDIMVCVIFKGELGLNIIGEIQIQDERMHALKVKMHRLYKVKRATAAGKI